MKKTTATAGRVTKYNFRGGSRVLSPLLILGPKAYIEILETQYDVV